MKLDKIDLEILDHLQEDASMTNVAWQRRSTSLLLLHWNG